MTTFDSYCPPTARPAIPLEDEAANKKVLSGLPRKLDEMTNEQSLAVIAYYKSLTLRELRDRQDITRSMQAEAFRQKNDVVRTNCHITEELLMAAVMQQQFPDADFSDDEE